MNSLPALVAALLATASLAGCAGEVDVPVPEMPVANKQPNLEVQITADAPGRVSWEATLHNDTPLRFVAVYGFPLPFVPGEGEVVWNATEPAESGSVPLDLPAGTWHLRVRVEDQAERQAWSNQETLTVAAPSPEPLPELDAGADQQRSDADGDGQQAFQLWGTARAGPGQELIGYSWLAGEDRLSTSPTTTFTRPVGQHLFTFQVTYRDAHGTRGVATDDLRVTIAENQAPTADAGDDQTIPNTAGKASVSIALDGAASNDTDGAIQSYEWSVDGQSILAAATGSVSVPADADDVVTHAITLTVTDDGGVTGTDTLTVKVTPPGVPVADAGPDITQIDEDDDGSETVTLDGSASFDPSGTITLYSWTDASGAVVATTPKVNVTLDVGIHALQLTVQNEAGKTDTDEVNVTVGTPEPLQAAFTHACSGLTCTFDATDSTGEPPLTFAWDFGDGSGTTDVTPEHTFASEGSQIVELTVTDGLGRQTATQDTIDVVAAPSSIYPWQTTVTVLAPCNFQCTGLGMSLDELAGVHGIDAAWVELPEGAAGRTFQVESTGDDPDVVFYTDIDCQQDPTPFMEAGPEAGAVPSGAVCARLTEFLSPASEITFSISNRSTGRRRCDQERHGVRKPDVRSRQTRPPSRDVAVAATVDARRDEAEDVLQEPGSP